MAIQPLKVANIGLPLRDIVQVIALHALLPVNKQNYHKKLAIILTASQKGTSLQKV